MNTSVHLLPLHLHGSWTLPDVGIQTDPYPCLGMQIFMQSSHAFFSEGNVHAPSSVPLPPQPCTSQTFTTFPLPSCVLVPKTVTALFTCLQDLESSFVFFYPINLLSFSSPLLPLPSLPTLGGYQQLYP